jgi:hypothetical protein
MLDAKVASEGCRTERRPAKMACLGDHIGLVFTTVQPLIVGCMDLRGTKAGNGGHP